MTLPTEINLAGVLWPPVILVGIIFLFILIKRKALGSLTVENGKISLSAAKADARDNNRYRRDKAIMKLDADLDIQAREITQEQKKPLKRALRSDKLCSAALSAITSDLLYQLYDAVNRNDFKHKLSKETREAYILEKLNKIRAEYEDFVDDSSESPCSDSATPTIYPHWHEIQPHVERTVRVWAGQIVSVVIATCQAKIEVYKEYMPEVEEAKDEYDLNVLVGCIAKNRNYIEGLGGTV